MGDRTPNAETERIWRELSDRLRQFIQSRVRSSADVDDILQLVFLKIHKKADSLRSDQRLESWVFQITRNAIVDHFRNQRADELQISISHSEPAEDGNANAMVSQCLVTLIGQLPKDQRRAVLLYELDGLPQAAIARHESISLSAAKSRIQRGRQHLKTLLLECCRFQLDGRGNVLEYQRQEQPCRANCQCDDSYE